MVAPLSAELLPRSRCTMDEKEKQDLLRFVAETRHECHEIVSGVTQSAQETWERLAGPHLAKMMNSPSATVRYLSNPDSKLREAALYIFEYHWGLDRSLEPVLERMALEDTDENVRGIALHNLVSLYKGTNDMRIGKLLANFVKDESLSTEFRITVYCALFRLRGLSSEHWPRMWLPE